MALGDRTPLGHLGMNGRRQPWFRCWGGSNRGGHAVRVASGSRLALRSRARRIPYRLVFAVVADAGGGVAAAAIPSAQSQPRRAGGRPAGMN